jgi:microcystin-dependent protein
LNLGAHDFVGEIVFTARSVAPAGFLKCNGAAISRTAYADLFAAIGTTYGAGDGSTTFNVPETRGEFLRCLADGRAVDTGRALGSAQADAFKSHTHTAAGTIYSYAFLTPGPGRDFSNGTVTTSAAGDTETRPRNIAFLACIRY